jgi:hypothetical protein
MGIDFGTTISALTIVKNLKMENDMKDNSNKMKTDVERLKRMNFSEEEEISKENPLRASDQSKNDERDRRVREETDTERLRSERESVQDRKHKD